MITKGIMLWSFNKFIFDPLDAIFNGADNKNYIGWPSIGGWWGGGVADKKMKFPHPTGYVHCHGCFFKETSQHLLQLPKMQLPLFVCACESHGDRNGVDCVSQCFVSSLTDLTSLCSWGIFWAVSERKNFSPMWETRVFFLKLNAGNPTDSSET